MPPVPILLSADRMGLSEPECTLGQRAVVPVAVILQPGSMGRVPVGKFLAPDLARGLRRPRVAAKSA